jgi:hypothetical protein
MAKKKKTRLEKSTAIIETSKATQWCYVNTDNEFTFMNQTFVIDENVEDYKVYNKAGTVEDYTNEAYMEDILVVIDNEGILKFYNQNYDEVDSNLVEVIA